MAKIAGTIVTGAVAIAVALGGCEYAQEKIAGVVGDEAAVAIVDIGCTGGVDFVHTAAKDASPLIAEILRQGAKAACAARPEKTTISAVVYDTPVAEFCGTTKALTAADEPNADVRVVFNAARAENCV